MATAEKFTPSAALIVRPPLPTKCRTASLSVWNARSGEDTRIARGVPSSRIVRSLSIVSLPLKAASVISSTVWPASARLTMAVREPRASSVPALSYRTASTSALLSFKRPSLSRLTFSGISGSVKALS